MEGRNHTIDDRLQKILVKHGSEVKNLIPILSAIQDEYSYLPAHAIAAVSAELRISEDVIFGVATFYTHFKFKKPGQHIIKTCLGTACFVKGADNLQEILKDRLGIQPGQTTGDGKISLERVACLGCCALAPTIVLDDEVYGKMTSQKLSQLLDEILQESEENLQENAEKSKTDGEGGIA